MPVPKVSVLERVYYSNKKCFSDDLNCEREPEGELRMLLGNEFQKAVDLCTKGI